MCPTPPYQKLLQNGEGRTPAQSSKMQQTKDTIYTRMPSSEPLLQEGADRPQVAVHLARRLAETAEVSMGNKREAEDRRKDLHQADNAFPGYANLSVLLVQARASRCLPPKTTNLFEAAQDVDLGAARHHDASLGRVLDRVLGPPVLAHNAAHGARQVVALERLDVLDLEGLDVDLGG